MAGAAATPALCKASFAKRPRISWHARWSCKERAAPTPACMPGLKWRIFEFVRRKIATRRNWPPPDEILRAINSRLPSDVCLLDVAEAPNSFHARHDAVARTYMYQISTRRTAFFKKYVWWVSEPLDVAAMARAARMLIGPPRFPCFPRRRSFAPRRIDHRGGGGRRHRRWRAI